MKTEVTPLTENVQTNAENNTGENISGNATNAEDGTGDVPKVEVITVISDLEEWPDGTEPISSAGNERTAMNDAKPLSHESDITIAEKEQADAGVRPSTVVAVNILKVLNYKIADYTQIRTAQWPKLNADGNSVPANYENQNAKPDETVVQKEKTVSYISYITQCMKAFDEKKYPQTIELLQAVLQQYPDDVNAQFLHCHEFFLPE